MFLELITMAISQFGLTAIIIYLSYENIKLSREKEMYREDFLKVLEQNNDLEYELSKACNPPKP